VAASGLGHVGRGGDGGRGAAEVSLINAGGAAGRSGEWGRGLFWLGRWWCAWMDGVRRTIGSIWPAA